MPPPWYRNRPGQGGHIAVFIDALEACHQNDPVPVQLLLNSGAGHPLNSCRSIGRSGFHAHLPAGQGNHRVAQPLNCHCHQRNGHLLSGGQQHIHLPLGCGRIDLRRFFQQVVSGIALSREHHHHLVPLLISICNDLCHVQDPLGVCHRAAAELLNNQCHSILQTK